MVDNAIAYAPRRKPHLHFEVCGEAENGAEAIEEAKKLKPDLLVNAKLNKTTDEEGSEPRR